ncbi:MAG: hypothetical protein EA384_09270 [Spirochaetaceae bacterium]|nr:MAG: hypothetical protein EA384_09270 [Spirochaetaceae bacterium]
MNRRVIASWAFLLFAAALFAAMVLVMHDYVRNRRITREMAGALQRIDQLLEQRRFDQAETEIERAIGTASSSLSWLRLIRRARVVAEATGRARLLGTISNRAAEALPGNRELQALAVYADLRTGEYLRAAERGSARLADDPRYRTLVAEAFLRAGRSIRLADEHGDEPAVLTTLGRDSTSAELLHAETITGDPRFGANAVLRALEDGDWATADEISDDLRFARRFALLHAYLQFDHGDFDGFFQSLERIEDQSAADDQVLLMTADVSMLRGEYLQAARLYDEVRIAALSSSELPPQLFLNRAWLSDRASHADRQTETVGWLQEGLAHHPGSWEIRRALAIEIGDTDPDRARHLLVNAEADRRASADLLLEQLLSVRREVSAGIASLWQLAEAYPHDEAVRRYLAWFLVGLPHPGELDRLLSMYPGETADDGLDPDPLAFYRGVAAVGQSELGDALEHFTAAARNEVDWYAAVNAARIALFLRQYDHAAQMVELMVRALRANLRSPERESTTVAIEAALLAAQGEFGAAAESARAALELDRGNVHARTVLRYLETR